MARTAAALASGNAVIVKPPETSPLSAMLLAEIAASSLPPGLFNIVTGQGRSVGDALRQSKNFLMAYSLLKEKRLGKSATRTGANIRSAWAFTLWGDPTLKLPLPPRSGYDDSCVPFVRHDVLGNTIVISLPEKSRPAVQTDKFRTDLLPNERAAGLVSNEHRPITTRRQFQDQARIAQILGATQRSLREEAPNRYN